MKFWFQSFSFNLRLMPSSGEPRGRNITQGVCGHNEQDRVRVCARLRMCVYVCVRERERERTWVGAEKFDRGGGEGDPKVAFFALLYLGSVG